MPFYSLHNFDRLRPNDQLWLLWGPKKLRRKKSRVFSCRLPPKTYVPKIFVGPLKTVVHFFCLLSKFN